MWEVGVIGYFGLMILFWCEDVFVVEWFEFLVNFFDFGEKVDEMECGFLMLCWIMFVYKVF